ncbi:MAG: hypothetical protein M3198_13965 [Actinomycetota bacterium]|nr:hypothetical protein [Actinomycetota bacterium]
MRAIALPIMAWIGMAQPNPVSADLRAVSFSVSVSDGHAREGDSMPVPAVFTVTLSAPQATPVTMIYDTAVPATDRACPAIVPTPCAEPGEDYALVSGPVVFPPGETVRKFEVPILPDERSETTEWFPVVVIAPALNWSTDVSGGIEDDDPGLLIDRFVRVVEGNSGTKNALINVSLSTYTTAPVTVDYATATDVSYPKEHQAAAREDYQATSGRLTFAPGETRKTIVVKINGDPKRERDETFLVRLSRPTNAVIWYDTAYVSIVNDD